MYNLCGQFKRQGGGGAAAGLVAKASHGRAPTRENVCGDKELEKIWLICLPLFLSFERQSLYLPNGSHDRPTGSDGASGNHLASQEAE